MDERLTEEEKLATYVKSTGPIPETALHIIYYGASKIAGADPWKFGKVLDSAKAYSSKLHDKIELSIKKGYISKSLDGLLAAK